MSIEYDDSILYWEVNPPGKRGVFYLKEKLYPVVGL